VAVVVALAILFFAFVPSVVFAQASVTGIVKDTSGAVLPGVTVEAASPALIERVRTAVADGTGQYLIADLRPGTYTVTFTLTGFSVVKRVRHQFGRGEQPGRPVPGTAAKHHLDVSDDQPAALRRGLE
jgi:hypothetical protein